MEPSNFSLLGRVVRSRLELIAQETGTIPSDERGSSYREFVQLHLAAVSRELDDIETTYEGSDEQTRTVLGRKLERLMYALDGIHGDVFNHRRDPGRRDLPAGLVFLIDALVDDLLEGKADPVLHLDGTYMYSTERLVARWSNISSAFGTKWPGDRPEPVVFNLPGLDPSNALLAPILVHEVGHSVLNAVDLVGEVEKKLDQGEVQRLKDAFTAADNSADIPSAMGQLTAWIEELLCDALATELTGPSMLFASAAFLPASSAGRSGASHPDPAQRLKLTLLQLEANGWNDALYGWVPATFAWLRAVSETTVTSVPPHESFLRAMTEMALPAITDVAKQQVTDPLAWTTFEGLSSGALEAIDHGIPPVASNVLSPWQILCACWIHGIRRCGDSPAAVAQVANDAPLGRFALKAIEMGRVLQLWRGDDAATA